MKAELVQNGFNESLIELHAPVPRSAAGTFESSFDGRNRIVYAGQIIRGKGVDVLLEALARVQTPFECVILGDGNHRTHCEQLSHKLGLAGRVTFAGFVSQAKITEYYRDATIAAMSSLWPEPFGATGLEAMRCGLPVVAFDAGGIREWLIDGWNGSLVPWMNRERYASAIDALLADKTLARRMGENGRQWIGERFGFPEYISGLEDLFRRVITPASSAMLPDTTRPRAHAA
jgi:glycosyltransferase involved in cell wall biosynthesis